MYVCKTKEEVDFMDNYRCIASNCDRHYTCGHYKVEKFYDDEFIKNCREEGLDMDEDLIIDEDLSDICLPKYRLYIQHKDKPYQHFDCKENYKKLFFFYDGECEGEYCFYQRDYDETIKYQSSCVECKLSEYITCTNPKHPTNKIIDEMMACFRAEEKAFEDAGIEEGTVNYTCPICGDEAVASRYSHEGRLHGLGSGCRTCGTWHT